MKKIILILFFSSYIFAQPGSYDITFSSDGISSDCLSNTFFSLDGALQSDGKILSLGNSNLSNRLSLVRYNSNGSFDTSFGVSGVLANSVYSIFPSNRSYTLTSIAIQSDNKIVIAGYQNSDSFGYGFSVIRLLQNGAVDTTFNGTGYFEFFFGTIFGRATSIKIQPDGKIIVAGTSGNASENFAMIRINTNGTLDTSFGTGGKVQISFFGAESVAESIVIQPDGKIILGGWTNNVPFGYDFALIRYSSNGSIDTTFGINGKIVTTVNSFGSDLISKIILQSDGKIIAGGLNNQTSGYYTLARYLSNGTLDNTFGVNGIAVTPEASNFDMDIALQIDGKIVIAGGFNTDRFSYLRYLNNGQLDTTFPIHGGIANIGLSGYASTVLIQPDNKIVICGSLIGETNLCSLVVRLDPGPLLSNEEFEENELVFYPNPTENVVSFDNSVSQFQKATIINYLGQEVGAITLENLVSESLDLSGFSNGVYLVKLENSSTQKNIKIIKK
jgi:uncharacterized delta-60 repeat protein